MPDSGRPNNGTATDSVAERVPVAAMAVAELLESHLAAVVRSAARRLQPDAREGVSALRVGAAERVAEGATEWLVAEWAAAQRGDRQREGCDPIVAAGALLARRAPELTRSEIEDVLRATRDEVDEAIRGAGLPREHALLCLRFSAAYFARVLEGVREESAGPRDALLA